MSDMWALWVIGCFVVFTAMESFALITGRATLSKTVWQTEARFPILSFFSGMVVGGLAIHFFGWLPSYAP